MTNHVTNKDLSQKLADAGVDVESEFYWVEYGTGWKAEHCDSSSLAYNGGFDGHKHIPAYLLSELLEMLPKNIRGNLPCSLDMEDNMFHIGYKITYNGEKVWHQFASNENPANAAASLLLGLIVLGHLDVNKQ